MNINLLKLAKKYGKTSFLKESSSTKAQQSKQLLKFFGVMPRYSGSNRTFYI